MTLLAQALFHWCDRLSRPVVGVLIGAVLACSLQAERPTETRSILMVAGNPSHQYGAHEHYAGLKILESELQLDAVEVMVVRGWPQDDTLVDKADTIVIYSDGGKRHVATPHLKRLEEKTNQGCGLVCLHYAVETVPGEIGDKWLELMGGHFEINYSVNPHWTATFDSFPDHPIAKGIEPFSANDEWYFHLRFKDSSVTPILASVAPESTMRRSDGSHSGNPLVRKSVAAGDSQTLAWAYDRPDGGRSFGFTGGHHHWNWAHPQLRRLVSQAILWTAKSDAEKNTIESPLTLEALVANQDYDQPKSFDAQKIIERFQLDN